MSDRALKKATELVGQFLNRMPGPERQAPNEAEIRMDSASQTLPGRTDSASQTLPGQTPAQPVKEK